MRRLTMEHNKFRMGKDMVAPLSEFMEEADYMLDMEIGHSKQNRVRLNMDDSRWDKDYFNFLIALQDYFEAKFVEEEEEEEDPNYALFLRHLREFGAGYMLDVSREHGLDYPITYYIEADPYCDIKRKTRQFNCVQKERNLKFDGEVEIDPSDAKKRRPPISNHITHIQKKRRLGVDISISGFQNSCFVNKAHSFVTKRQAPGSKRSTYMQKEGSLGARPPRYNHRTHIQTKKRLDADGESKSGPKNSILLDQTPFDVIHRGTPSSSQTTDNQECILNVRHPNSGLRNCGLVHEISTADVIKTKGQSCGDPFLQELRSWDADEELNTGVNSFCFGFKVDDIDLVNSISRRIPEPPQNTRIQNSKIMDVDTHSLSGLSNSDAVDKLASESLHFNRIGTRRSTRDACNVKTGRLDVDKQSKSDLEKSGHAFQTDPSDAIKENSGKPRPGSYVQVKGRLGENRKIKSGQAPDEMYNNFLACLKLNGESLIYEYGDHKQIHYEDADEHFVTESKAKTQPRKTDVKSLTRTEIQPPKATVKSPAVTPAPSPEAALKSPTGTSMQPPKADVKTSAGTPAQPPLAAVIPSTRPPIQLSKAAVIQLPEAAPKSPTRTHSPPPPVPIAMDQALCNYQAAYRKLFRKLAKMLQKPYDQKEYDDLLNTFSARKPVQMHRTSRSGGTQKTGRPGRSYFDLYKDFSLEVEKVKSDSHKVLNLLRMFRFYLEKLAHGNIPKPWLNDEFKSILPGSA